MRRAHSETQEWIAGGARSRPCDPIFSLYPACACSPLSVLEGKTAAELARLLDGCGRAGFLLLLDGSSQNHLFGGDFRLRVGFRGDKDVEGMEGSRRL
jgi:hypothetical protein